MITRVLAVAANAALEMAEALECKKRGRTTCCQKCHREIKWWLSTETRKSLEERKMSKLEVLGLNEEAHEDVEQKSRKRARDGAERDDEAA